ncbi:hypothetical protein L207DRAFT_569064 [Hyaloscypha variabilis F]|uniref:Uncharacterized protein n=1 Tax=Hyaloscypha variabilis (strain UAMH 11265 / GT02V1 / F) TaxID=1149755 RepID=A0A2J6REK4_HYAVF|nr:hypothetical protein L207DRAFT_569064 [Hyaloscypha variabilis F]
MGTLVEKLIGPIIICAFLVVFLLLCCCLVTIMRWEGRLSREFDKLSREAEALAEETQSIRAVVNEVIITDRAVRSANLALLSEADEWDTSIRICLMTLEDLMSLSLSDNSSDTEKFQSDAVEKERHGKHMINMMRARCQESMGRRKALRRQLQRIRDCMPPPRPRKEDTELSRSSRAVVVGEEPSHGADINSDASLQQCADGGRSSTQSRLSQHRLNGPSRASGALAGRHGQSPPGGFPGCAASGDGCGGAPVMPQRGVRSVQWAVKYVLDVPMAVKRVQ